MDKKELAPGIMIYSNVMENHETFIPELEEVMASGLPGFEWRPPYVLRNGENVVDPHVRDLHTYGVGYEQSLTLKDDHISPMDSFHNILGNRMYTAFDPVEKDYKKHYGVDTDWHDLYNILKYGKDHFFVNHIDDNTTFHRRISVIYYVNDDYEGGEINFERFGIKYKPQANQMLLFPSTYVYNHSVSTVLEGTRYSIVSWLK